MHAGVAELIRDGLDGFILRQFDDFQGLAQMLQRLHADEDLRRNTADAAAKAALQWTWDRNAADVWELLRDTVGKKLRGCVVDNTSKIRPQ
jgi:glycosyltransferase involved in cell wall biosynthesis